MSAPVTVRRQDTAQITILKNRAFYVLAGLLLATVYRLLESSMQLVIFGERIYRPRVPALSAHELSKRVLSSVEGIACSLDARHGINVARRTESAVEANLFPQEPTAALGVG